MGRKKSDNPKNVMIHFRVDEETRKVLEYCRKKTGMTISSILRSGLYEVYMRINKEDLYD